MNATLNVSAGNQFQLAKERSKQREERFSANARRKEEHITAYQTKAKKLQADAEKHEKARLKAIRESDATRKYKFDKLNERQTRNLNSKKLIDKAKFAELEELGRKLQERGLMMLSSNPLKVAKAQSIERVNIQKAPGNTTFETEYKADAGYNEAMS